MSVAEKMTAINDAIRGKTGKTDKLSLDEMATEINEISSGERDINPEWTDWRYFCAYGRYSLGEKLKYSDTSNGTNFSYMYREAGSSDSRYYPYIDTSKGTNFSSMFSYCTVRTIPEYDTSKGTSFSSMFSYAQYIHTIPKLDLSNGTSFSNMFSSCKALENLNIVGTINATGLNVQYSPLSHDSLMSIINALANKTGVSGTWKVTLGATNLAKLTADEIAIAEGKGWTLA